MATDYTTLITSEYRDQPYFVQAVALLCSAFVDIQTLTVSTADVDSDIDMPVDDSDGVGGIASAPALYDLDAAVGMQLDTVGLWIGFGRMQNVPSLGTISLSDDDYRSLLRAKVFANHWDGSMEQLQSLLQQIFPSAPFTLLAVDNQDMTMDIFIIGGTPSATQLALLEGGLIVPRPEGVLINGYTAATGALFGLDYDTSFISGPDVGAFSATL